MMRVTFLGTSGSTPTKARNLPAVAINYNGRIILFDCGEGTQRQMMIYSVNISKIDAIFLSHLHGDHIIGIAGLIRTLALNKRAEPLNIFIPKGQEKAVKSLIEFDNALIGFKINIMAISGGDLFRGDGYTIKAFKLSHTVDTYGLSFIEDDKTRFIEQKAKKIGLKGEMFGKLLKEKTMLINGKKVHVTDVTMKIAGRKIVYATDTRPVSATVTAAKGANILIHEATYADEYKNLAKERGHSTSVEGAKIAKRANVNILVLTHISARYKSTDELLNEAKAIFKNTSVAYDGMTLDL